MAITSGGSFGFFMGVGSVMRSQGSAAEKIDSEDEDYMVRVYSPSNGHITNHAIYKDINEDL